MFSETKRRVLTALKHHAMTIHAVGEIRFQIFLTLTLHQSDQFHAPAALYPRKEPPVPIG